MKNFNRLFAGRFLPGHAQGGDAVMRGSVITITLNPAFDIHYDIDNFKPYRENFVRNARAEAGGKGINISRALSAGDIPSVAYVVVGREGGERFERELEASGLKFVPFYTDGRIRQNITLHSPGSPETRISLDDFSVPGGVLEELFSAVCREAGRGTVVAFSGRVPRGADIGRISDFLLQLRDRGARLAVDSGSLDIETLCKIKPWLVKPNEQELENLIGRVPESPDDAGISAEALRRRGIENVMVSLGGAGAVLAGPEGILTASAPAIAPLSTIGAGDSAVAGFIAGSLRGLDTEGCLREAVCFGTAACLTEGTRPPRPGDIERLRDQVAIGRA